MEDEDLIKADFKQCVRMQINILGRGEIGKRWSFHTSLCGVRNTANVISPHMYILKASQLLLIEAWEFSFCITVL